MGSYVVKHTSVLYFVHKFYTSRARLIKRAGQIGIKTHVQFIERKRDL